MVLGEIRALDITTEDSIDSINLDSQRMALLSHADLDVIQTDWADIYKSENELSITMSRGFEKLLPALASGLRYHVDQNRTYPYYPYVLYARASKVLAMLITGDDGAASSGWETGISALNKALDKIGSLLNSPDVPKRKLDLVYETMLRCMDNAIVSEPYRVYESVAFVVEIEPDFLSRCSALFRAVYGARSLERFTEFTTIKRRSVLERIANRISEHIAARAIGSAFNGPLHYVGLEPMGTSYGCLDMIPSEAFDEAELLLWN